MFMKRIGSRLLSSSANSLGGTSKPTKVYHNQRIRKSPIEITQRAATKIKELIVKKGNADGVRIGVKRRGCNGYSYTMEYANVGDIDARSTEVVKDKDVTVLVDHKAIFFIIGTVMDYQETELASEFTFINPNVKGECGCGESFNV